MKSRFRVIGEVFSRLPAPARGAVVVVAAVLIAATDLLTPTYVSFTGYYLIPLFLSIWYFTGLEVFVLVLAISLSSRLYITEVSVPADKPFWESAVSYGSIVVAFTVFTVIVTMLKKYVHQVLEYSDKDALTGLKNRRSFLRWLSMSLIAEIAHAILSVSRCWILIASRLSMTRRDTMWATGCLWHLANAWWRLCAKWTSSGGLAGTNLPLFCRIPLMSKRKPC